MADFGLGFRRGVTVGDPGLCNVARSRAIPCVLPLRWPLPLALLARGTSTLGNAQTLHGLGGLGGLGGG